MGLLKILSPEKKTSNQVSKEQNAPTKSARVVAPAKDTAKSPKETVAAKVGKVDPRTPAHRFSLPSISFNRKDHEVLKTALPAVKEQEKSEDPSKPSNKVSSLDESANNSALALRSLIVGPTSTALPSSSFTTPAVNLGSIKSELLEPNTAIKVIAKLKELPSSNDPSHVDKLGPQGPIHAVCLACTDAEMDTFHFSKLTSPSAEITESGLPSIISAPVDKIAVLFKDMHLVDLVNAPDFGLGQPGDGPGILAGALPTAETVIEGVERITPELMALGYATGKAVMPDHSGMYPPTDRISVLTYWWGLELLLPSPTLVYLGRAQSITHAVMNFLSALALIENGVREILPFIRYISQYVDFEFNTIKGQDKGKGVVCAATWIMPAALVPRPWDFPSRPQPTTNESASSSIPQDTAKDTAKVLDTSPDPPTEDAEPPQSNGVSSHPIPHDTKASADSSTENPTKP